MTWHDDLRDAPLRDGDHVPCGGHFLPYCEWNGFDGAEPVCGASWKTVAGPLGGEVTCPRCLMTRDAELLAVAAEQVNRGGVAPGRPLPPRDRFVEAVAEARRLAGAAATRRPEPTRSPRSRLLAVTRRAQRRLKGTR